MSDGGAPDGAGADAPGFKGAPLGDQCPPADATKPTDTLFIRLVPESPPCADDFRSGHVEGKTPPKIHDPCIWRACSFFLESTPKEVFADLKKYKNHANKKFKVFIRVNQNSGVIKISESGNHISFWMYETFLPETAVERIEPL